MFVLDCQLGIDVVIHHPELVNLYGCKIGAGTKIGTFVEIGQGVEVGCFCKIQTGAFIPPGIKVGDRVFIGPNATFCNTVRPMTGEKYKQTIVEDDVVIGANATILPGITIHEWAFIGAGAVVTKDVPFGVTVYGNPAREQTTNYDYDRG